VALPPAAVGNSPRPVLEMQKWAQVVPRGERQPPPAGSMGTPEPESSMPSGAFAVTVARTS
jgi:hypothetical protein